MKGIPDKTEIPEIKKIKAKHDIKDIFSAVAEYYKVKEDELLKRKKSTERQRKIAIYLCKTLSGNKNIEVGRVFGITLQAVTNVLRDIEKRTGEDKKLSKDLFLIKKSMKM